MYDDLGSVETVDEGKKAEMISRNIHGEKLIKKIKDLEETLEGLTNIDSVQRDIKEIEMKQYRKDSTKNKPKKAPESVEGILSRLLECFNELLKTPYGSLGYLIKSDAESILNLYGIDTNDDYYLKLKSSITRGNNRKLEKVIVGGGGRKWIGEGEATVHIPIQTPENGEVADKVVNQIIKSIHEKLEAA